MVHRALVRIWRAWRRRLAHQLRGKSVLPISAPEGSSSVPELPDSWIDSKRLISILEPLVAQGSFLQIASLLKDCQAIPMDENLIYSYDSQFSFASSGYTRVATTDPGRLPGEGEVVVCYGSYPPGVQSLCFGAHIRRFILDYWDHPLPVDRVEAAQCWQRVDRIIYINLDSRSDRRHSLLREFAGGGVPLDRVERLPGERVGDSIPAQLRGSIGCLMAHLKACRRLRELGVKHGLIFEDDFGFSVDKSSWQADLEAFFERGYDYDVCLLATSKFGPIEPLDDLVCMTRQPCTNATAYLVSAAGLERLIPCFERALAHLRSTQDVERNAADRCWAELQGQRFLLFNRKLGYQLASYSDIESNMACYLD